MVDHELLQAISQMLDEKLNKALDEKLSNVLDEKFDQKLAPLKEEVRRIAIAQENTIIPQLQLVYENEVEIIDEHKAITKMEQKIEVLQDEVFAIKETLKELKRA